MRPFAVGAILTVVLGPPAPAQTVDLARAVTGFAPLPPPGPAAVVSPADRERVRPLVAALGADDFRARERAGRDLLALGDRGLPALRAALPGVADPEARRRLQAVVDRLDADRLRSARLVTLKVADRTPKELITEIARQSGYPIHFNGDEGDPIRLSLDVSAVPFWLALDRVCDQAGLTVNDPGEDGALAIFFSDTFNPHVSYDGPFKVIAGHVAANRSLPLAGLSRRQPNPLQPEYINLNLTIQAEPKAPIVGLGQPVLTRATDDRGTSLLPPPEPGGGGGGPNTSYYPPVPTGHRSFAQTFGAMLARLDRSGTAIRDLRGRVPVALLSEVRPEAVVPSLLSVKKKRVPGRTVDLEVGSVSFQNDVLAVELTFRRRAGDADDYSWLNGLSQRVEVTDAAGRRLRFNGVTAQHTGANVCTLGLQFTTRSGDRQTGKPDRLYLMEWLTVTREVSFRFKDIPLP